MKEFKYLEKEYRDDTVADALYQRETELYHYQLNIDNYQHTLDSMPGDAPPEQRAYYEGRIVSERQQMAIAMNTYNALLSQAAKDPAAHEAACARCKAKRDAAKKA